MSKAPAKKPEPPAGPGAAKAREQFHHDEDRELRQRIHTELTRLRDSQAELASAMLQFLQYERSENRKQRNTAMEIIAAIRHHQRTGPHPDSPEAEAILDDAASRLTKLYADDTDAPTGFTSGD